MLHAGPSLYSKYYVVSQVVCTSMYAESDVKDVWKLEKKKSAERIGTQECMMQNSPQVEKFKGEENAAVLPRVLQTALCSKNHTIY